MSTHYNVAPRYSPGSPALVSREIAERVATDEKRAIDAALSGFWGEKHKARAELLGLRGIVEQRKETRKGWEVLDMITGERFLRLFPTKLEKLGFRRYNDLQDWEQKVVDNKPPPVEKYQQTGWFKIKPVLVSGYFSRSEAEIYQAAPIAV